MIARALKLAAAWLLWAFALQLHFSWGRTSKGVRCRKSATGLRAAPAITWTVHAMHRAGGGYTGGSSLLVGWRSKGGHGIDMYQPKLLRVVASRGAVQYYPADSNWKHYAIGAVYGYTDSGTWFARRGVKS